MSSFEGSLKLTIEPVTKYSNTINPVTSYSVNAYPQTKYSVEVIGGIFITTGLLYVVDGYVTSGYFITDTNLF